MRLLTLRISSERPLGRPTEWDAREAGLDSFLCLPRWSFHRHDDGEAEGGRPGSESGAPGHS